MKKIGLISDTHGMIIPRVFSFLADCDLLWHAGDIGNIRTLEEIESIKPLTSVYGNIDDHKVRSATKETAVFWCEKVKVAMIHIGGYPGKYTAQARNIIREERPNLFIAGHSHILKVMYDKANELLYINPGAAGNHGFHQAITAIKFIIDGDQIKDMEVFELTRKGQN